MRKKTFNLLFEEPKGVKGNPLFSTQADLARVVFEEVKPSGFSSFVSLKTYINRVLRGERPASDTLKDAILNAIKIRAGKEINFENLRLEFLASLSEVAKDTQESKDKYFKESKEKFLEVIVSKGHHVFITDYPFQILNTEIAQKTKKQILANLGMLDMEFSPSATEPPATYEYYISEFDKAIRIWQEFSDVLEQELLKLNISQAEAKDRLFNVCRKPYEFIQVFRTFQPIAAHNLYLFNIDDSDDQTMIFRVDRNKDDVIISEIPLQGHETIREHIYSYLRGFLRDEDLIKKKYKMIALEEKKFGKIKQFNDESATENEKEE